MRRVGVELVEVVGVVLEEGVEEGRGLGAGR